MVINAIKKYFDSAFIKPKIENDKKIQSLNNENEMITSKYNYLQEEYTKEKKEYKDTMNTLNETIIEYKLREKSYEEKIKNFDVEKKTLKETNERAIQALNKENETKIENYTMDINKLKNELNLKASAKTKIQYYIKSQIKNFEKVLREINHSVGEGKQQKKRSKHFTSSNEKKEENSNK